jgi:hypothetical protein
VGLDDAGAERVGQRLKLTSDRRLKPWPVIQGSRSARAEPGIVFQMIGDLHTRQGEARGVSLGRFE